MKLRTDATITEQVSFLPSHDAAVTSKAESANALMSTRGRRIFVYRLDEAVKDAEVVMMLRLQLKRTQGGYFSSVREMARRQ